MHDHCTAKKVSRQCLAQRAAVLRGLCARECGRAISAEGGVMCDFCRAKNRTAVRARTGCAPWRSGGAGRPPLGKRAETHAIKAAALKKLNPLDRFALCLTPKPERRALRAAALAKLSNAERGVLHLGKLRIAKP